MPISWPKPRNVITLFHNPAADISFSALILLRQAQLYNKETNPRPVTFDLDVCEPPRGMTIDQRRVIDAVIGYQNQEGAAKAAKNGTKFTPASTINLAPPLVVSWHTNEVATGSLEPVKEILQKMRVKQWANQEKENLPLTPIQDFTRRVKAWWTLHD